MITGQSLNIAHSLAHHTVAIDRRLPLPALLTWTNLPAKAVTPTVASCGYFS